MLLTWVSYFFPYIIFKDLKNTSQRTAARRMASPNHLAQRPKVTCHFLFFFFFKWQEIAVFIPYENVCAVFIHVIFSFILNPEAKPNNAPKNSGKSDSAGGAGGGGGKKGGKKDDNTWFNRIQKV